MPSPTKVRIERANEPTVGSWKLHDLLQSGPITQVFRAQPSRCRSDGPADYVVKYLRPEMEDDPIAVELIRREASVGRQVFHPNLVSVLDAKVDAPPYYLVMPYLAGNTLRTALDTGEVLSTPQALWIARQVADALSELHHGGWMHGDVKPENIFLSHDGHVTLLDLGFVRRLQQPGNIVDRPLLGTFHYVAPELITSTLRADQRSDVYSLGATLYEMLTGRVPFSSDNPSELARSHLCEIPTDPRRIRPQLPNCVARLLRSMLAKEPLRRPQTADELKTLLFALEIETFDEYLAG